jgi:chromate reductase
LFGAVWAQADARRILSAIGARVAERELPVAEAQDALSADGALRDPELERAYRELLSELVAQRHPGSAVRSRAGAAA